MNWWQITLICIAAVIVWCVLSVLLYRPFFKRFYDFVLSGCAIVVLLPIFLVFIVLGAIKMKGNPFFIQKRPGRIDKRTGKERIFNLIKFRTMTCEKDADGNLLPDEKRLTLYGKILRATSIDELPELFNIFVGDMSVVGPRPLLVKYLPLYNDYQRQRHLVRPGLTGLAQISGRNAISWEQKFTLDVEYINNISVSYDLKIIFATIKKVFAREGISQDGVATMTAFEGNNTSVVIDSKETDNNDSANLVILDSVCDVAQEKTATETVEIVDNKNLELDNKVNDIDGNSNKNKDEQDAE